MEIKGEKGYLNRNKIKKIFSLISELGEEEIKELKSIFLKINKRINSSISEEEFKIIRKKITAFEFIGLRVRVISKTFKNVSGIIIGETKNTFKILTLYKKKGNKVVSVPKKGNTFVLSLKGERFKLLGDELTQSPIERAKRWKHELGRVK